LGALHVTNLLKEMAALQAMLTKTLTKMEKKKCRSKALRSGALIPT